MRKTIYAFALLLAVFVPVAQAQITITDTDMPSLNDTIRLSTTTDQWSVDATSTGAGYNWNFSFLYPESQKLDTCADVASLPIAYQFYFNNIILYAAWKANFGMRGQEFDLAGMFTMTDVYNFYKKGTTKYQNVGFGANINGIPASVRKNPIETVYSLPMSFGDSFTNYSEYVVTIPSLGEYREKKTKSAEVDGWGTVTIPMGTFPVLRMKVMVNIIDSIYVDAIGFAFENPRPTQIEYHWLAQNKDVPVLQINADSTTGAITQIIYQDNHVSLAGITEALSVSGFDVYPNPVSNLFTVKAAEPIVRVELYDISGRRAYSTQPFNTQFNIQLPASIDKGTYVIECTSMTGTSRKKLVVQR